MPFNVERFWAKVDKAGLVPEHRPELGPCWIWTAKLASGGYGSAYVDGRRPGAHRVAYELCVGPIPDGLVLDHLCRNPPCVNPAHLEPVTNAENQRRGLRGVLRTHCVQGHEYTPENTYRKPGSGRSGRRDCRACIRARVKKYKARKAVA